MKVLASFRANVGPVGDYWSGQEVFAKVQSNKSIDSLAREG